MFVNQWMKTNPVTVTSEDYLATAQEKMRAGSFRHLPVVDDGKLIGIITDRDLRQHLGHLERTKVNAATTENAVTVGPRTTLEEAAKLLLKHKINGLPVVDGGRLTGMITTSDILKAFLDAMGALEEGTVRIDLLIEGKERTLAGASEIIARDGGEILGMGTYQGQWEGSTACYLRLRAGDPERLADTLKKDGYKVLGVQA
jgi:acetoin utilization protein AcuB